MIDCMMQQDLVEKPRTGWADRSINYLDEKIEAEGPFYGLLGYSQGSAFIPVYLGWFSILPMIGC